MWYKCFLQNVVCEEFVLRSLRALPLRKPFFAPGGWDIVLVIIKACTGMSLLVRSASSHQELSFCWIIDPCIIMMVSKKFASIHDISAINFIVGGCLFPSFCPMNFSTTSLLVCQREIMSSIQCFQASGLWVLSFRLCFFLFGNLGYSHPSACCGLHVFAGSSVCWIRISFLANSVLVKSGLTGWSLSQTYYI